MPKTIELNYTNDAKKTLDDIKNEFVKNIEDNIKQTGYVPGESSIEVTASDVLAASRKLKQDTSVGRIFTNMPSSFVYNVLYKVYLLIGIAMLAYGISSPQLVEIYLHDRLRFMIILTGFIMILLSYFLKTYISEVQRRRHEFDRLRFYNIDSDSYDFLLND